RLEQTLEEINSGYVGWAGYFNITIYPSQLKKIEAHIRRRLRSRLIDQQKSKRNLYRKLVKRGVSRRQAAKTVFTNNKRWKLSARLIRSTLQTTAGRLSLKIPGQTGQKIEIV
ncbi:hypothetical protein MNBD_GAMMA24-366, partial [hydrothermal vent metagenome]